MPSAARDIAWKADAKPRSSPNTFSIVGKVLTCDRSNGSSETVNLPENLVAGISTLVNKVAEMQVVMKDGDLSGDTPTYDRALQNYLTHVMGAAWDAVRRKKWGSAHVIIRPFCEREDQNFKHCHEGRAQWEAWRRADAGGGGMVTGQWATPHTLPWAALTSDLKLKVVDKLKIRRGRGSV
jgi:hypothetical protein